MALITDVRWSEICINEQGEWERLNNIWVFKKKILRNSGHINIYTDKKLKASWTFDSGPQILEIGEAGYNLSFISGFGNTLLSIDNINSGKQVLFIREHLWDQSLSDLDNLIKDLLLDGDAKKKKDSAKNKGKEIKKEKWEKEEAERLEAERLEAEEEQLKAEVNFTNKSEDNWDSSFGLIIILGFFLVLLYAIIDWVFF